MATTIYPSQFESLTPRGRQILTIRDKSLALLRHCGRLQVNSRYGAPYAAWRNQHMELVLWACAMGKPVNPGIVPITQLSRVHYQLEIWSWVRPEMEVFVNLWREWQREHPKQNTNPTGKVMNISWAHIEGPLDISTFR